MITHWVSPWILPCSEHSGVVHTERTAIQQLFFPFASQCSDPRLVQYVLCKVSFHIHIFIFSPRLFLTITFHVPCAKILLVLQSIFCGVQVHINFNNMELGCPRMKLDTTTYLEYPP